jgi:hypothetical protein
MTETLAPIWTSNLRELWDRIERHNFEPDQPFNFTKRLSLLTGWSIDFTRSAVLEYRRFCFLAFASPEPVTPSEEIDEVWHLHLTFSHDYWENWCRSVLRGSLHHDPSRGDQMDQRRLRAQYAATLACYEGFFGAPSKTFWPATHIRFRNKRRFRTVDLECCFVLPRPWVIWQRLSDRRSV